MSPSDDRPNATPPRSSASTSVSADAIAAVLPQTQCTRCGYADCQAYAQAIASGEAGIDRCPPGGEEGIARLAAVTGLPPLPLDTRCGTPGERHVAWIDEAWCIGCTLCIQACPVDCIVGAHKRMHTVIEDQCTGCELCLPACPVDCIQLASVTPGRTGWAAWSPTLANQARQRYLARTSRQQRLSAEHDARLEAKARHKLEHLETLTKANTDAELARKRAVIEAALARARARRGG